MKAIILERRGEWAAALREDGVVLKTRQDGEVGETIELPAEVIVLPSRRHRWARTAVAAALALVIAGGSFTYYNTAMAASYVSVDVGDSSVELAINRRGKVIEVTALNHDSEALAKELTGQVKQKDVEEAMDAAMSHLRENGYLSGNDDLIVGVTPEKAVPTSGGAEEDVLTQAVERSVERNRRSDERFYVYEGHKDARDEARRMGQSGGKFFAERQFLDELAENQLRPEATPPAWLGEKPAFRVSPDQTEQDHPSEVSTPPSAVEEISVTETEEPQETVPAQPEDVQETAPTTPPVETRETSPNRPPVETREAPPEQPQEDTREAPPEQPQEDIREAPPEQPQEDMREAPPEQPKEDVQKAPPEQPKEDIREALPEQPQEDTREAPPEQPQEDIREAPPNQPQEDTREAPPEQPQEDIREAPPNQPREDTREAPPEQPQEDTRRETAPDTPREERIGQPSERSPRFP